MNLACRIFKLQSSEKLDANKSEKIVVKKQFVGNLQDVQP